MEANMLLSQNILLSQISVDTLLEQITSRVTAAIEVKQKNDLKEKLLSPSETCELFHPKISKVTLNKWTKEGHIQEHRIGGRIYYKYSQVLESLKTLKRYKRVAA